MLRICHLGRNLSSVRSKPSQYLRSGHFGPGEQVRFSAFAAFEFCYRGEQRCKTQLERGVEPRERVGFFLFLRWEILQYIEKPIRTIQWRRKIDDARESRRNCKSPDFRW